MYFQLVISSHHVDLGTTWELNALCFRNNLPHIHSCGTHGRSFLKDCFEHEG
jgi:hypothetical protein